MTGALLNYNFYLILVLIPLIFVLIIKNHDSPIWEKLGAAIVGCGLIFELFVFASDEHQYRFLICVLKNFGIGVLIVAYKFRMRRKT